MPETREENNQVRSFKEHSTEYEIFVLDECVAITDAYEDACHHAFMYQQDGVVRIYEVKKTRELLEVR